MNNEFNPNLPENDNDRVTPESADNAATNTPPAPENANGYTAEWSSQAAPSAQQPYTGGARYTAPAQSTYQGGNYNRSPNVVFGGNQHTGTYQNQGYQNGGYSAPSYRPQPQTGGGFPPPPSSFAQPSYAAPTPKEKKYASRSSVVVAVILAVLLSLGCGIGGVFLGMTLGGGEGGSSPIISGDGININHYDSDYTAEINTDGTVASVVNKVSPAVVEIFTDTVTYSEYFGQQITSGAGSGVIITKDGYIITCAHVIDGATKITVRLNDGTDYEAKTVGSDAQTDIAVIKIEAKEDLTHVGFGTSDNLVVGQPVIAIGNPLGSLGGTVTTGIISATNREIEIEGQIYNLLQTNAAINSGNSGGGLFDMNGNLIGVVNAKSSGTSIEGLGFAIPSTQAEDIATQLMAYGYVKGRPLIGVKLIEISSQQDVMNYWQYNRFITDFGVYIIESEHDSLELGDRIVAMDGTEVDSMATIQQLLQEKKVGDTLEVTVSRLNGRKSELVTVTITLRERTAED